MSDSIIKLLIGGALLLHGLGHLGAVGALWFLKANPNANGGGWTAARSWLFPSLSPSAATTVAIIFWVVSALGFVAAALSFWGFLIPGDMWRTLAVASAFPSLVGILLFFGNWPMFNTIAALAMNVAVLITQLWSHWPEQALFGK